MNHILSDMRIIELSAFIAAPLAGLTLGQMGAEIIRIDPEEGGLDYNRWPLSDEGRSLYWTGLNKGKKSVTLDLRSEKGRDQFRTLLKNSGENGGILLTNLVGPKWLSYDALKEVRPDLIMVSLTGHHDGKTAVDYTVNCALGFPSITGNATPETPINSVMPTWDAVAGTTLATGLLAAERHRNKTGEGQHVKLSLSDVGYSMMSHLGIMAEAQLTHEPRPAIGNHIFGTFGHDFFTKDGRKIMLVALTKRQWQSVKQVTNIDIQMAELEKNNHVDLDIESSRYALRDEISEAIGKWVVQKNLQEIADIFDAEGICWGVYQTFKQMAVEDSRASLQNPLFEEIYQDGVGTIKAAGSALEFSNFERASVKVAPKLGENTVEILKIFQAE